MGQTRILPGFQSESPGIKLGACCLPGLQNHTLQKSESLFSFSFPFNLFIFSCFYHHFFAHAQTSRFYSPTCLGSPQSLWCYCPGFSSPFVLHVHLQAHSELNQNMELENKKKKKQPCVIPVFWNSRWRSIDCAWNLENGDYQKLLLDSLFVLAKEKEMEVRLP